MEIRLNTLMNVSSNIISENIDLKYALERLGTISVKVLFVVDCEERFVATITDGDVRRAILAGASLTTPIAQIANYHPVYLCNDDRGMARKTMDKKDISAVPCLDKTGKIMKVYIRDEAEDDPVNCIQRLDVPVVIMAGGRGTRLYPYTKILPKPLIPVSGTPISERIIRSFQEIGCKEFHMIVNYKRNMIKAYYNDTDNSYNVHFWDEEVPLGTGGGVFFLRECISDTFVLTNCDILILDDVRKMIEHHKKERNKVTMVCSLKNFEIPYGIVHFSDGGEISSFEEKPQLSFFTNTGYYILEPDIFNFINLSEKIGMPDIIDRMRLQGEKVGIYPISENAWLDMGQFDSMESMERKLKELNIS